MSRLPPSAPASGDNGTDPGELLSDQPRSPGRPSRQQLRKNSVTPIFAATNSKVQPLIAISSECNTPSQALRRIDGGRYNISASQHRGRAMNVFRLTSLLSIALITACTSSPLGRNQLILVSDKEADRQGNVAYRQIKEQTPREWNAQTIRYVNCIANHILDVVPDEPPSPADGWEVTVFDQEAINAFALPGGNIGVFTGILGVAENQDQLAAVLGHEVAHVMARHSAERMSVSRVSGMGTAVIGAGIGTGNASVLTALGLDLPFGRKQEDEADLIGLDYMAKAGFDPRAAVKLWENMREKNPGSPPEFISTHPSSLTRIDRLNERMPSAMKLYEEARAGGKNPQC